MKKEQRENMYLLQAERSSLYVEQFNQLKESSVKDNDNELAEIVGQLEEAYRQFANLCYKRGGKNVN